MTIQTDDLLNTMTPLKMQNPVTVRSMSITPPLDF